jgi:hypothetical protein
MNLRYKVDQAVNPIVFNTCEKRLCNAAQNNYDYDVQPIFIYATRTIHRI